MSNTKSHKNIIIGAIIILAVSLGFFAIHGATPTYTQYSLEDSYGHKMPITIVRSLPYSDKVTVQTQVGATINYVDMDKDKMERRMKQSEKRYNDLGFDTHIVEEETSGFGDYKE